MVREPVQKSRCQSLIPEHLYLVREFRVRCYEHRRHLIELRAESEQYLSPFRCERDEPLLV